MHCLLVIITAVLLVTALPCVSAAKPWDALQAQLIKDGYNADELQQFFAAINYDPYPMRRKMQGLFNSLFGEWRTKLVQKGLNQLGYDAGKTDGVYGPKTRRALETFQKDFGLIVDGLPGRQVLTALQNALPKGKKLDIPSSETSVYRTVLMPSRLAEARSFYKNNKPLLASVKEKYGVDEEVAVGILTVETRLGENLGQRSAFVTLASMALCSDFDNVLEFFKDKKLDPNQLEWLKERSQVKAKWAYQELKALISYAESNNLDPLALKGSVYGAIGISQFMPSSVLAYGADGDGDGLVDLFTIEDAVHSLAHYLHRHGFKPGGCRETRKALYHYNRSTRYVNTVLAVADHLRKGDGRAPVCPMQ